MGNLHQLSLNKVNPSRHRHRTMRRRRPSNHSRPAQHRYTIQSPTPTAWTPRRRKFLSSGFHSVVPVPQLLEHTKGRLSTNRITRSLESLFGPRFTLSVTG